MAQLLNISRPVLNFIPAAYKANKHGCYIEYASLDPCSNSLKHFRIRLGKLKKNTNAVAFRIAVQQMILNINSQLMANHTMMSMPAVEYQDLKVFPKIEEQMECYGLPVAIQVPSAAKLAAPTRLEDAVISTMEKPENRKEVLLVEVLKRYEDDKSVELKHTTLNSYLTFCRQLTEWVEIHMPKCTANNFNQEAAVKYMEFVYAGGNSRGKKVGAPKRKANNVTPTTYNNNLKMARTIFAWAVEKCYATENPFTKIKVKREEPKQRELIPVEDRIRIYNYFKEHRPEMCIVMQLVYVSLLRPIEITRVRVRQVNFAEHCIEMPNTQTKNGKARVGRMDEALEALLRKHVAGADPDDYLFANKIWKCGKEPMNNHTFANVWLAMRIELKLPASYQLYSLRDSGVNNLLEAGVSAIDTMQAAGHSDLSMTTRYANHENKKLVQTLNEKAPSLFGEIKSPEGKTPPSSDETSHAH